MDQRDCPGVAGGGLRSAPVITRPSRNHRGSAGLLAACGRQPRCSSPDVKGFAHKNVGRGVALATIAIVLLAVGTSHLVGQGSGPGSSPADLLIRNVRIVHGDGRVTPRANALVRGGVIDLIQPLQSPVPAGADAPARHILDGTGRTLIPGLIDAHVHVQTWGLPLYLRYGVTTVRDLHNDAAYIFPLAADDTLDQPRIVSSGPIFDGPGGDPKTTVIVSTVGEARAAVRRQIDAGARVIEVSPRVGPWLMSVLASEARARGVPVAAHLGATTATQAADLLVTSIEHLSGIAESASPESGRLVQAHADFFGGWTAAQLAWRQLSIQRLEDVARDLVARGVTIVPTLVAHEAVFRLADAAITQDPALAVVPPGLIAGAWKPSDVMARAKWTPQILAQFKQSFPVLQQFAGIYARLGGRIAAGSDVGQAFVIPGFALHRELELLVDSGLSPAQAIRAATVDAAALLGLKDRVGVIDGGMAADLVLLDGDPLADIRNTRRIVAVIKNGIVVEPWDLLSRGARGLHTPAFASGLKTRPPLLTFRTRGSPHCGALGPPFTWNPGSSDPGIHRRPAACGRSAA